MDDAELHSLLSVLDQLIQQVEQLKAENRQLKAHEQTWQQERAHLIEKNETACLKIESMITRLKAMEQNT